MEKNLSIEQRLSRLEKVLGLTAGNDQVNPEEYWKAMRAFARGDREPMEAYFRRGFKMPKKGAKT